MRLLPVLLLAACGPRLGHPTVQHGAEPARVPLVQPSTDSRRWYVPIDAGEAGTWLFFVDTGYTHSTCDDDFVRALGLQEKGHSRVWGEMGSIRTGKARLPDLMFGRHRVQGLVCQTRDLADTSSIDDPDEVPVAGVLGMDLFRAFHTRFDAGTGTMELTEPDPDRPRRASDVKMRREQLGFGLRVILELDVDGQPTKVLVDTGATDTYVDGDRLGLEPDRVREGVRMRGTGKRTERTVDILHYDIERIGIGDAAVGPVVLTHRDRTWGAPGLLGQDVLSLLRSEFDWHRGWARFEPVSPATLPSYEAWRADPGGDVPKVSRPVGEQ